MDDEPKQKKQWWAGPLCVVVVLLILGMFGEQRPVVPQEGSTFDAGPVGVRAAYLVLQGLGFDVAVSKRVAQGRSRCVLFPKSAERDFETVAAWVRDGGRLLLADDHGELSAVLGLPIERTQSKAGKKSEPIAKDPAGDAEKSKPKAVGPEVSLTIEGKTLPFRPGPIEQTSARAAIRRWPEAREPLAEVHAVGRGEVWLVRRADFLRNERLQDGANAVVLCRLAEAFAHGERIYFDEFFHGIRERPNPIELLLEPPTRWVALQSLGLLAFILWRYLPRFGALEDSAPPRRRSKEEYVDALANLLEKKRAYPEAYRAVQADLSRELEQDLGLPADTPPEELARCVAARNRRIDLDRALRIFAAPRLPRRDPAGFLSALNEMERLRHEYFNERHDR